MNNEQVANKLQGINGLLMGVEGFLDKYGTMLPHATFLALWDARGKVVALARYFEPPLEKPDGTPHIPASVRRRWAEEDKKAEEIMDGEKERHVK